MNIRRRLEIHEAMNFCERRGYQYQMLWNMDSMWYFEITGYMSHEKNAELKAHIERWNAND